MSAFHPAGLRLKTLALASSDQRDVLSQMGVPTLLLWGQADARSPMRVASSSATPFPAHGWPSSQTPVI